MSIKFHSNCRYDAVGAMRAMEKFTQEVGGYPFLYADIFMTREEFEEMFDLTGMVFCSKYCSDQLIAKNLRMQQFIQTLKGQNNFLNCNWRFQRYNRLEQSKCQMEQKIGM